MKKILSLTLATLSIVSIFGVSTTSANGLLETIKQKYTAQVNYCKNENNLLKLYKDLNIKEIGTTSELKDALMQYPYLSYRTCDDQLKPIILSAFNQAKNINGKSTSVVNEFKSSGARSGSSFYSSTLGETVGVVDAKDMINGVGESYKYVIKTNQAGQAKLMVNAGTINNTSSIAGENTFVFKAGRYAALAPKNSQVAKIGNTYFIYVK